MLSSRQLPMDVSTSVDMVVGGRHWTRTSDLLHVKHFRLSAVLRAQRVEHKCISYAVTVSAGPAPSEPLARESGHGPEGAVSRHTEVATFISLDVGRDGVALARASRSVDQPLRRPRA